MAQQNLNTAIGNISSSPFGEQFYGMIDEVRIWRIARTQAQIAANMNDLPNPTTYSPNLAAYYKFNNNLVNSAGSGFNGTAQGTIAYGPEAPAIQQLSIISVTPGQVTCYGAGNGSVTITASGSGVSYSINGTTYVAGNTFTNLAPGSYTAYIRSAEGCIRSQPFTITQPAQLTRTITAGICTGQSYSFGGTTYNTTGTYTYTQPGTGGCDSTTTLNLTVTPSSGPPPPASHFNTGTNGSGGTLPGGAPDASWTVSTNNINGPFTPAIVMAAAIIPGSYYNSPWPDCKWISHNAAGTDNGSNQAYYYRTDFTLPCFNSCGESYLDDGVFCLNLDFFADNSVYEIFVNGVPQSPHIPGIPVADPYNHIGFQLAGMVSASLCSDWRPGNNTLIIEIRSGGGFAGFLAQTSINPPPAVATDTVDAEICSGQTYAFGGNSYNTTGRYTVTFHTVNGCDSLVTLDLLVKPIPATPAVTSNSPVCEGQTLQLNTPAAASAVYAWSGPSAWTSSAQNPARTGALPAMSGTYTLSVTVNGCTSAPGSASVTVNPLPATPAVQANTPLCEGQTLLLSGNGGVGVQYHWTGPDSWTSTVQNAQRTGITPAQSGTYTLYTTLSGCTSATAQQPVTVHPKPTVSYTGALTFCGTDVSLSATAGVPAPDNIASVNWYSGGSQIGSGTTAAFNFSSAHPTTQVTVTGVALSNRGCGDTDAVNLTLYARPEAHFEWEDLCDGSHIQFTDDSGWDGTPAPGATYTHAWDFGDGQSGSGASPNHAYADTGTYAVTLTAGSSESTCTDQVTLPVTVHPQIQVTLTITPPACGQSVSLQALAAPYAGVSGTSWSLGDGNTSADTALTHTYQQPGLYQLTFTVNTNHQCTFTGTGQVEVKPSPTLSTVPLPNIITPNGDNVNNALILDDLFADCVEYEMKIMGRWGNLVYTQRKGSEPFAGKGMFGSMVTPGVYFYVIKSGTEEKTGTITVNY